MTKQEMIILEEVKEKIKRLEPLTSEDKRLYLSYALTSHTGKMEGIDSFSTAAEKNERCKARAKNPDLICFYCYAISIAEMRKGLKEKLILNTIFFTTYRLEKKDIPFINSAVFRLESFGDLNNTTQAINYILIVTVNSHCYFAWWSKNPDIIKKAMKEEGLKDLPVNTDIIYSIPEINPCMTRKIFLELKKEYPFIKKLFGVFTKQYIQENDIVINCGAKACLQKCRKCYTKSDRTIFIREQKK